MDFSNNQTIYDDKKKEIMNQSVDDFMVSIFPKFKEFKEKVNSSPFEHEIKYVYDLNKKEYVYYANGLPDMKVVKEYDIPTTIHFKFVIDNYFNFYIPNLKLYLLNNYSKFNLFSFFEKKNELFDFRLFDIEFNENKYKDKMQNLFFKYTDKSMEKKKFPYNIRDTIEKSILPFLELYEYKTKMKKIKLNRNFFQEINKLNIENKMKEWENFLLIRQLDGLKTKLCQKDTEIDDLKTQLRQKDAELEEKNKILKKLLTTI